MPKDEGAPKVVFEPGCEAVAVATELGKEASLQRVALLGIAWFWLSKLFYRFYRVFTGDPNICVGSCPSSYIRQAYLCWWMQVANSFSNDELASARMS